MSPGTAVQRPDGLSAGTATPGTLTTQSSYNFDIFGDTCRDRNRQNHRNPCHTYSIILHMIRIPPASAWTGPSTAGLDLSASEWHLDPDRYREFIETATGIAVSDDPTASDCYRIGNRLEALIEERRRRGEWTPALVESYPDVESLSEIVGLARFFRRCHDCRLEEA